MSDTCIYVIGIDGEEYPVKIGQTNNLTQRFTSIQSGNHRKLEIRFSHPCLENPKKEEKAIHDIFKTRRIRGEWFNVWADEAIEEIEKYFCDLEGPYIPLTPEQMEVVRIALSRLSLCAR